MDNGWQDRKIARLQDCKTWGDPSGQPKQPVNQNIPEILQSCNLTILQSHDLGIRCPSNMSGTSSHWPRIFPWMLQSYNLTILQSCNLTILQSCDLAICCPWETSGTSSPRARIFSEILQSYNLAILQSYNLAILQSYNLTISQPFDLAFSQPTLHSVVNKNSRMSYNLAILHSFNLAILQSDAHEKYLAHVASEPQYSPNTYKLTFLQCYDLHVHGGVHILKRIFIRGSCGQLHECKVLRL